MKITRLIIGKQILSDSNIGLESKIKRIIGLITLSITLNFYSYSQSIICGGYLAPPPGQAPAPANCQNNSIDYVNKYSLQSFYVPTVNDPVITINITFHIFNNSAGNGNYQPTGPTNTQINTIAGWMQNGYDRISDPRQANLVVPGFVSNHIADSRVKYNVTHIYFYNDNVLFTSINDNAIYNYIAGIDPDRVTEGLPIIFNNGYYLGAGGYATSVGGAPLIHTFQTPAAGDWFVFEHLRHEMGHTFGWHHTYAGGELSINPCSSPDFLSDVFPINNSHCSPNANCNTCPEDAVNWSNNVLSSNSPVGTTWMSPLQMGRRIRNLHLPFNNVRSFAKEMISDHQFPWLITSNETWDFDIQMYRDIVVKSGNTLTIKCRVAMATDGKITVEKGAKLIVDGGEITGWCKKTPAGSLNNMPLWSGIEIDGSPFVNQLINGLTGYCPNQGIVEIKNNGIISYAFKGIITSRTINGTWINNTSGGIVLADNANFINNVFDIIFYKYQQGNVTSKIINSNFETTGEIGRDANNNQITPAEHLKLYQNWGLKIEGCRFEYAAGTIYPQGNRGAGVYATDSHFNIDWYCNTSPCISGIRCKFNNLTNGVWIDNFNPLYIGNIQHSDFNENDRGAVIENSNYLSFFENNITMTTGLIGVYLYKCKYYNVRNNNFSSLWQQGAGIIVYDSKDGAHQIYRNTFSDFNVGILCEDNNGGYSFGTNGLKMNCNDFTAGAPNTTDISMSAYLTMPVVMAEQSSNTALTGFDLVRNLYGATYVGSWYQSKWNVDPSNNQVIIHSGTPSGSDNPNSPMVQASPQVLVGQYAINFNYATHCLPYPQSGGGSGDDETDVLPERLANMNSYLSTLYADNYEDKNHFEIQVTNASKMNLFLTGDMTGSNDSIFRLLSSNPGNMNDSDLQLVFTLIRNGQFIEANERIKALPDGLADWKMLLSKVVEIEQEPMGIYSLLENQSNVEFLKAFANNEGRDGQACAQAMLKFVFGTEHFYPVVFPSSINNSKSSNLNSENSLIQNTNIKLFPIPAKEGVNIVNSNVEEGMIKIEITDLFGRIVFEDYRPKSNSYYIPLGEIANGVYIVVLETENYEIIYRNKFVKQD